MGCSGSLNDLLDNKGGRLLEWLKGPTMSEAVRGSGREVSEFNSFCEGDIDPTLNKEIRVLIDCDKDYIVYLDTDLYVEWSFNLDSPDGFQDVANRIGRLETISITQIPVEAQRAPFERLLGESMARILGDKDEKAAEAVLDEAEEYLKGRGAENARRWLLRGVAWIAIPALVVEGVLLLTLNFVSYEPWREVLEVLSAAAMGSVGAFLSVAWRTETITFEPVAGPDIHQLEGIVRVIAGIAGALLVALAIKADLLLGIFHSLTHPFPALLISGMIAGTSERFVRGLISTMGKPTDDRH